MYSTILVAPTAPPRKPGKGWRRGKTNYSADDLRSWVANIDRRKEAALEAGIALSDREALRLDMQDGYKRNWGYSDAKVKRLVHKYIRRYQQLLSRTRAKLAG